MSEQELACLSKDLRCVSCFECLEKRMGNS